MTRALDDSEKQSYLLIEFEVAGTYYRFTNWATTIDPGGENWISMPEIDVKWPRNTGTLAPNGCIILGNRTVNSTFQSMVDLLLADGSPTPKAEVTIKEVILPVSVGDTATTLVPFKGRILRAVKNANGRSGLVRFEVQNIKSRLDVSLGLPCNHHCPWSLFGRGCSVQGGAGQRGPQRGSEIKNATVSSINGKTLTVSANPGLTGSKSFAFGYVERNGVRVAVQDWDSGTPTVLILRQQPPAAWVGQTVVLVPGCDKTLDTCANVWNNESNFGGIGYAVPAYDPHFEDGA